MKTADQTAMLSVHELQDRYQGESSRCFRRLPLDWKEVSKLAVAKDHAQLIVHAHHKISLWKNRTGHAFGFLWHMTVCSRVKRHGAPPDWLCHVSFDDVVQPSIPPHGNLDICDVAALPGFASNIEVLENLAGRWVLRNDLDGRVHMMSDGRRMWVMAEAGTPTRE